ncbi:DUF7501 family protein [Halalkalicoccus ordinarius]
MWRCRTAGVGFIDHRADVSRCEERFEAWREQVRDDIGEERGGLLRFACCIYRFDNIPWPTEPERGELDVISPQGWKQ